MMIITDGVANVEWHTHEKEGGKEAERGGKSRQPSDSQSSDNHRALWAVE